jgi:hypothetical protein
MAMRLLRYLDWRTHYHIFPSTERMLAVPRLTAGTGRRRRVDTFRSLPDNSSEFKEWPKKCAQSPSPHLFLQECDSGAVIFAFVQECDSKRLIVCRFLEAIFYGIRRF